jgi:hypothetical protein
MTQAFLNGDAAVLGDEKAVARRPAGERSGIGRKLGSAAAQGNGLFHQASVRNANDQTMLLSQVHSW